MVLAVVRIKGKVNVKKEVDRTMQLLKINKKHHCTVIPSSKQTLGMLRKISKFITWGEIEPETLKLLITKRGKLPGNKRLTEEYVKEKIGKTIDEVSKEINEEKTNLKVVPGLKTYFKLKPPSKGFERKGIKKPYSLGGAFGYRGKNINSLLLRMI